MAYTLGNGRRHEPGLGDLLLLQLSPTVKNLAHIGTERWGKLKTGYGLP